MTDIFHDIEKAEIEHRLQFDQLVEVLTSSMSHQALCQAADRVRSRFVGSDVYLRGLIEFSNRCQNNCLYCGLRKDNKRVKRYHLSIDEIVECAQIAKMYGYQTVVLQSGEDPVNEPYYPVDTMVQIIQKIKAFDLAVTLSLGEKTYEEYKAYKEAGADRYLLRIETTNKDLYHRLDPGMSWENRHRCLIDLRKLDYEVGSGVMVGLPGQTPEDIANDILFFKEMDFDMIGIGPFIPHPDTPLKNASRDHFELSLRAMALTRLLLPDINIPATTAMETLCPNGRVIALESGANVVMPNVTGIHRKHYEIYPNKAGSRGGSLILKEEVSRQILEIGRTIGTVKGFRGDFLGSQNHF